MKRYLRNIISGGAAVLLSGAQAVAQSSSNYSIPWFTFSAGGEPITATAYTAVGTVGHFETVTLAAGPYILATGFWSDSDDVPQPAGLKLTMTSARGRLIITWEGCGVLEQADTVLGTWTAIAGALSPYVVDTAVASKFYRLRRCER